MLLANETRELGPDPLRGVETGDGRKRHRSVIAAIDRAPHDRRVTRRVVMVAFEGFQILDLTGPMEVFADASRALGAGDGYAIEVVSR